MHASQQNYQVFLLFLLGIICLIPGIGLAPLFLEEPRRALVAMEMLYSNDYLHTTIHGEPYYNKPPLFNWIIAGGFHIFGFQEWILRAITLISHLLTGLLVYAIAKYYIHTKAALLCACLYLTGADILFYFSLLGEIDVFFSLLVVAGWCGYFHFSEKQKWTVAFLCVYFFMALAFLTKGLPALLFLGFTIIAWQGYQKKWQALFSPGHFVALAVFLIMISLYFYPYIKKGDFNTLVQTLWSQSLERTTNESNFFKRLLLFITFPISLWKDILPASLLILFFSRAPFRTWMKENRLFAFSMILLIVNIWIYWISPDSRSRYLYMFHPLLIWMLVWAYHHGDIPFKWQAIVNSIYKVIPYLIVVLLLAANFLIPIFLPDVNAGWLLAFVSVFAISMLWISQRGGWLPIFRLSVFLLILRLPFGYITSTERSLNSQASIDKKVGGEMAEIIGDQPVYMRQGTRISTTISYYLQQKSGRIIPYTSQYQIGDFIILPEKDFTKGMISKLNFTYQGETFSLVKINEKE
jgi:4-amino-4-deoxy-L-arabinose transferase-like glycosyltransferase